MALDAEVKATVAEALAQFGRRKKRDKNPNRIGAAHVIRMRIILARRAKLKELKAQRGEPESSDGEEDATSTAAFLPNFGGVWQAGPRSLTRMEFTERKRRQEAAVSITPAKQRWW